MHLESSNARIIIIRLASSWDYRIVPGAEHRVERCRGSRDASHPRLAWTKKAPLAGAGAPDAAALLVGRGEASRSRRRAGTWQVCWRHSATNSAPINNLLADSYEPNHGVGDRRQMRCRSRRVRLVHGDVSVSVCVHCAPLSTMHLLIISSSTVVNVVHYAKWQRTTPNTNSKAYKTKSHRYTEQSREARDFRVDVWGLGGPVKRWNLCIS